MKVCVMGLGFVGLTLGISLADVGAEVHGVELNGKVVASLRRGVPTLSEKGLGNLLSRHLNRGFFVHERIPKEPFSAYIICVGTPIDEEKNPVLDHVLSATEEVARSLRGGELVAVRSTVPVGTTRRRILPTLETVSGKKLEKDFHLVYAPERTAEGNALQELRELPQIIGGTCDEGILTAMDVFRRLTPTIVTASSLEVAEMIKLVDNCYRDYRFAFSNEVANICELLGLDATECITKANISYSRNNIASPSPGVGGPCLTKDPYILFHVASSAGYDSNLLLAARSLNESIPINIAKRIKNYLRSHAKSNPKIFIMGFSFKGTPSVNDVRNSNSLDLLKELNDFRGDIFGHDPIVPSDKLRELGVNPVSIEEGFKDADVIVVMTNDVFYAGLDITKLSKLASPRFLMFDCWRLYERRFFDGEETVYMSVGLGDGVKSVRTTATSLPRPS